MDRFFKLTDRNTSVFCGDFKKIKVSSWIIAALFIAMLLLTH